LNNTNYTKHQRCTEVLWYGSCSCSTSSTHRATLVTVISHWKWEDGIVITTNETYEYSFMTHIFCYDWIRCPPLWVWYPHVYIMCIGYNDFNACRCPLCSMGILVSSTNKIDSHNITEIVLTLVLNHSRFWMHKYKKWYTDQLSHSRHVFTVSVRLVVFKSWIEKK
jgi:hypothetical protein